jgi:hypothetical protein
VSEREEFPLVRGLIVDEGSRELTLSVVAILDPSPDYPDVARVIVGSTAGSEAQLSFHGSPVAMRELAWALLQASYAAERGMKGGGS